MSNLNYPVSDNKEVNYGLQGNPRTNKDIK